MINHRELRIGNLLKVGAYTWEVDSILTNSNSIGFELYFKENDDYDHSFNAEPIPLTPEWLTQFGFNKSTSPSKDLWYLELKESWAELWFLNGKIYVANEDCPNEEYATETKVETVHQLQNLFHALTGEELTLKDA